MLHLDATFTSSCEIGCSWKAAASGSSADMPNRDGAAMKLRTGLVSSDKSASAECRRRRDIRALRKRRRIRRLGQNRLA